MATIVKVAVCPAVTVVGMGWFVTTGITPTVSVAVLLVTGPAVLVTTQRNWSLSIVSVHKTLKAAVVVPLYPLPLVRFVHVPLPAARRCH